MEDRIEFDSVVTEKALINFKMYHNLHTISGISGYLFAVIALVLCVMGIATRISVQYILMMGIFGVFFLAYPILSIRYGSRKQMKSVDAFKSPMHYSAGDDKIIVSQSGVTEELEWNRIYKVRFTGSNLILYLSSTRANILTLDSMGDAVVPFVELCKEKLKPFQVRVNMKKLKNAVAG